MGISKVRLARPLFLLALVAVLGLAVAACGGGGSTTSSGGGESGATESDVSASEESSGGEEETSSGGGESVEGKKVYMLTCGNNVPYCARIAQVWEEKFSDVGVSTVRLADEFSASEEAAHLNQAVSQGADLILWEGNAQEGAHAPLLQAKQQGIPVVLVGTAATPPTEGLYTTYIGPSDPQSGAEEAETLQQGMEAAGAKSGKVLMITGTKGSTAVNGRLEGWKETIGKTPYEVVAEADGSYDPVKAAQVASPLLSKYGKELVGATAMSGSMAAGVVKAAEQSGLDPGTKKGQLVITGTNCDGTSIEAIEAGKMYATTNQGPVSEGEVAFEVGVELLEGKEVEPKVVTPNDVITKANVAKYAKECTY